MVHVYSLNSYWKNWKPFYRWIGKWLIAIFRRFLFEWRRISRYFQRTALALMLEVFI
jgi:hypothetical protein